MNLKAVAVRAAHSILGVLILGAICVAASDTVTTMPDHAFLFIDPEEGTYIAPPCLEFEAEDLDQMTREWKIALSREDTLRAIARATGLLPGSKAEARALDLKPDYDCIEQGGFMGREQSSIRGLAAQIGIFPEKPDRWREDGSWRW